MVDRARITRTGSKVGVTGAVGVRRRRSAVSGEGTANQTPIVGDIIEFGEEDFISGLLRACPPSTRHGRRDTYTHVSDVIGKCPRKVAFSETLDVMIVEQPIYDGLGLTFAQGDAIHEFIRNRLRDGQGSLIFGNWRCVCGELHIEKATYATAQEAGQCGRCGKIADNYHELGVVNAELDMVGSPDLPILHGGSIFVSELKSIAADAWKELVRPIPDHVIQVLFYWKFMREAGYRMYDKVSIVYATKGFQFKSPYKEFTLHAAGLMHRLDDYIEDARAIKAAKAGGALPSRKCPAHNSPEAKKCQFAVRCFNTEG